MPLSFLPESAMLALAHGLRNTGPIVRNNRRTDLSRDFLPASREPFARELPVDRERPSARSAAARKCIDAHARGGMVAPQHAIGGHPTAYRRVGLSLVGPTYPRR